MEDDARSALIEAACEFWFHDNDRVRSPFPAHIQPELKRNAQRCYLEWLEQVEGPDRGEMSSDELASSFELFLFREALALVGEEDPDLVLTLNFPFVPRVGDLVRDATRGESRVTERRLEQKEDGKLTMTLSVEVEGSGGRWESECQIPT